MANLSNTMIRLKAIEAENYTLIKVMNASSLINPFSLKLELKLANLAKGIVFTGTIPPLLLIRLYRTYLMHPFLALDCGTAGYLIFHSKTDNLKVGLPVPR